MTAAFVTGAALPARAATNRRTCPRMSGELSAVDTYFPVYQRNRAPTIKFDGEAGISVSMAPIRAFTTADRDATPLFSYADPDTFVPNKPVPPSDQAWPSGDGRGVPMKGTKGSFTQPNLKKYGPFPDFFKVRVARFLEAVAA